VIFEDEKLGERLDEVRKPERVDAVQPRHVHDLQAVTE
jgi:hypothetical protein